ncbi:MAG: hypothetical protein CMJ46_05160 [Planctomyces sp.]|nr:hypothetical protein [Planctomyces sp.]
MNISLPTSGEENQPRFPEIPVDTANRQKQPLSEKSTLLQSGNYTKSDQAERPIEINRLRARSISRNCTMRTEPRGTNECSFGYHETHEKSRKNARKRVAPYNRVSVVRGAC